MVQGLRRSVKQPVAYYFSSSQTSSDRLVVFLRDVIRACEEAGLRVISTVCDMGSNNVRALKNLGATEAAPYFFLDGRRIYTVYDPCHLLKCTRNNWMKKPLQLQGAVGQHIIKGVAKWEHLQNAVAGDRQAVFQGLGYITDEHLNPKGKALMKVKLAAQVFSLTIARQIESEYNHGCLKGDESAMVTAFLVEFMDKLFDATNAKGDIPYRGKILRTRLTSSSPHLQFFEMAADVIRTWSYTGHTKSNSPPSQTGWLFTLRAIHHIWVDLQKEGFSYLETRALNQDPLENFNGVVRSNCGGNSNPTCRQYTGAFKTAIINNFAYSDMARTNCEFDNIELIDDLNALLMNEDAHADTKDIIEIDKLLTEVQEMIQNGSATSESIKEAVANGDRVSRPVAYIAGFIARRLVARIKCSVCNQLLVVDSEHPCHILIKDKEYNKAKKSLTYPSVQLVECVGSCLTFTDDFLNKRAYLPKIKTVITEALQRAFSFDWLSFGACLDHHSIISSQISSDVFFIAAKWWCTRQNRMFAKEQWKKKNERKVKHFKGI